MVVLIVNDALINGQLRHNFDTLALVSCCLSTLALIYSTHEDLRSFALHVYVHNDIFLTILFGVAHLVNVRTLFKRLDNVVLLNL